MKKFVAIIVVFIIAIGAVLYVVYLDGIGSKTLVVPDDYATIGWAVGNATAGDTVYVKSGTYNESINIDKPLSLIGEDMSSTIIVGGHAGLHGGGHHTISVRADNVTVSGFTIRSYDFDTPAWYFNGIYIGANNCNVTGNIIENCDDGVVSSDSVSSVIISKNIIRDNAHGMGILFIYAAPHDITITDNNITSTTYGIGIHGGYSCVISGNNVIDNGGGIGLRCSDSLIAENNVTSNGEVGIHIGGSNNNVSANYVADNEVGVTFSGSTTTDNIFYNNSFIDNDQNVQITSTNYTQVWDNGSVGNYWSSYNGTDNNGDGIGDTPYVIDQNNQDNYPLMEPIIIPEFPSWTPLLIMLIAVTIIGAIYKQRLHKCNHKRS